MPSATELLSSLQETLGFKRKKPLEILPVAAVTPTVAPPEIPAAIEMPAATPAVPALESAPAVQAVVPAEEVVTVSQPQADDREVWVSPDPTGAPSADAGLPDWPREGQVAAEELRPSVPAAPLPEPEAPSVVETPAVVVEAPAQSPAPEVLPALPVAEVPAFTPEVEVETDPFATSREFNGYMETIRQAQAVLASGIALTPEEQKKALIAVAKSNSLLPKLPPEVFKSVLLMRAVASGNPKFDRNDFQREMLAAMNVIKTGVAIKG